MDTINQLEDQIRDYKAILAAREREISEQNKYIRQLELELESRKAAGIKKSTLMGLRELTSRYMQKGRRFLRRIRHKIMR